MVKVFISYSSAQEEFVKAVADSIGLDNVHMDKYDFESGRKILDEIDRSIGLSNVFVLLISNEGLDSDWIKHEIAEVRDYIDEDKIEFLPFIIDEVTELSDTRIKPWIKKSITNRYLNPLMLARVIRRTIREIAWKQEPTADLKSRLFVGREQEMAEIYRKLYENTVQLRRAIIVSGLPHIGRKRLLTEFLVSKIQKGFHSSYLPLDVRLTDTDSIEEFIKQLNEYAKIYELDELYELLASGKERCVTLAVELINRVSDYHEQILISDSGSVVLTNGFLSDWFQSVVQSTDLIKRVSLLVASKYSLAPMGLKFIPQVQAISIHSLKRQDTIVLFNAYASALDIECKQEDVESFIDCISGYPEQVFAIVDTIKEYGIDAVKSEMTKIQSMFDEDIRSIVRAMSPDDNTIQALILMSKFEFFTVDILGEILDFDVPPILSDLRKWGLLDKFGSSGQYLRIDQSSADYIKRTRLPLKKSIESKLNAFSRRIIQEADLSQLDLATDLYRLKQMISNPQITVSPQFYLPTIALKVIIDEYRGRNYPNVITIADRLLNDYKRNGFESVMYSIHYWLCLSLCKTKDKDGRFMEEVKYFDVTESKYSYWFLKGFYYRNKFRFDDALNCYNKALSFTRNKRARHLSKSVHEITLVKMKMGDFTGALELAERSYSTFKWNSFHIAAYFRCYVRTKGCDIDKLNELLKEMDASYDQHKDIVLPTLRAEMAFYYEKNFVKSVSLFKSLFASSRDSFMNYAIDAFRQVCMDNEAMPLFNAVIRENKKLVVDENFLYDEDQE